MRLCAIKNKSLGKMKGGRGVLLQGFPLILRTYIVTAGNSGRRDEGMSEGGLWVKERGEGVVGETEGSRMSRETGCRETAETEEGRRGDSECES